MTSKKPPGTIDPLLREILACPKCKGPLEFRDELNEIHCPSCRLAYPIEGGIPVMLIDQARRL